MLDREMLKTEAAQKARREAGAAALPESKRASEGPRELGDEGERETRKGHRARPCQGQTPEHVASKVWCMLAPRDP